MQKGKYSGMDIIILLYQKKNIKKYLKVKVRKK
jgi:hypothetical protein